MQQPRVTFADAAYVVLAEARTPLHYKELAQRALDQGLFVSRGKTPAQTLRSQISREVNTRGEESRFVNRDQGKIELSDRAKAGPDLASIRRVLIGSGLGEQDAEARIEAVEAAVGQEGAGSGAEGAGSGEVPTEDAAPAEEAAGASGGEASEPATGAERAFVPVEMEPSGPAADDEDEGFEEDDEEFDGTFATAEKDPVLHAAPDELGDEDEGDEDPDVSGVGRRSHEDDSEQDFLSVGRDVRDEMESSQYEASMDELAPIVVPPHEGGAAEVARLPQGGRSVLIVKVVRRRGRAWIELVEELESLVSGVVGRLLLTIPGEDLAELIDALLHAEKVVDQSFERDPDDDEAILVKRARRARYASPRH